MLIDASSLVAIVLTALGLLGLPISIFLIFFEVTPGKRIHLSRRQMVFAIMWLVLLIIGIVNLCAVFDGTNDGSSGQDNSVQGGNIQGSDNQSTGDTGSTMGEAPGQDSDDGDTELSPEELLVKQNSDLIQQLKAEYSSTDVNDIGNKDGSVTLSVWEKAGYIFQDFMKTGKYEILRGDMVSDAKVIIFDYFSDEMICSFTTNTSGIVRYAPGNQKQFYAVIFHDNYDIYVTPPIRVTSEDNNGYMEIYLEGKESEYTPLCQFCLYVYGLNEDEYYSIASDYHVCFCCKTVLPDDKISSPSYNTTVSNSGILSWSGNSYFSLNTKYVLDIALYPPSNFDLESTHETVDCSVTNSNQIDLFFEFAGENDTVE